MTKLFGLALVIMFALGLSASADQSVDAKASFLASNPNNGWEYGFLDDSGKFIAYNSTFNAGDGIVGWALDHTPGPFGDVTMNYTDEPIDMYGLHWEPGQICVNASAVGRGTVVRWHASAPVSIRVDTDLAGQATGVKANVKIVVDGTDLGSDVIGRVPDGVPANMLPTLGKSANTQVSKDSVVDLIVSSVDPLSLGHVSAAITVNLLGPGGVVSSKTKPVGTGALATQAQKPQQLTMRRD